MQSHEDERPFKRLRRAANNEEEPPVEIWGGVLKVHRPSLCPLCLGVTTALNNEGHAETRDFVLTQDYPELRDKYQYVCRPCTYLFKKMATILEEDEEEAAAEFHPDWEPGDESSDDDFHNWDCQCKECEEANNKENTPPLEED